MSPSEIGFLALGIAIGVTAGAVLLAVVRPRSPLRPVVRVTVTPNALAPREARRAELALATLLAAARPGSPDEDARLDAADVPSGPASVVRSGGVEPAPGPSGEPAYRTRVSFAPLELPADAVAVAIAADGIGATSPVPAGVAVATVGERAPGARAGTVVATAPAGVAVRTRPPLPAVAPVLAVNAVGIPVVAAGSADDPRPSAVAPVRSTGAASPSTDPCQDDRTLAASACADADAARSTARQLADRHREAERALGDLRARSAQAAAVADSRRVAAEKDRLHGEFKAAHGNARSADEAEVAARDWLTAVSELNVAAREAASRAQAGAEEAQRVEDSLEALELQANAARISAERAEAACRAAREALAACEERAHMPPPPTVEEPNPLDRHWPGGAEPAFDPRPGRSAGEPALPVILRVLRGDPAARERLVARLAEGDPAAVAAWHVRIARFVDAVTARAIEAGFLEVDDDQPFWRLFTAAEQREIVLALSALGFRYDGLGGFADERIPTARDLTLAVGIAGLDRMRVRSWPGEASLRELLDGAVVRSDLWLATQADDLALGRVEAALGPRAAALDEVWDAWGRVRPAMLEER